LGESVNIEVHHRGPYDLDAVQVWGNLGKHQRRAAFASVIMTFRWR